MKVILNFRAPGVRIKMRYRLGLLFALLFLITGCGNLDFGVVITPIVGTEVAFDPVDSKLSEPTKDGEATEVLAGPLPEPTLTDRPTEFAKVLPAPVYFINAEDSQIWRVEVDGVSLTQITFEDAPVDEFDVSPRDGALVYISGNQLIYYTSALGGNRQVLMMGSGSFDQTEYLSTILNGLQSPRWSPDGKWIVFGRGGIVLYQDPAQPRQEGVREVEDVLFNDPFPDPLPEEGTVFNGPQTWYSPISWMADGKRILVRGAYYFALGEFMAILNLEDGSLVAVNEPDGQPCCRLSVGRESGQLLYWGNQPGFGRTGLWRSDPETGESVEIIPGEALNKHHLFAFPFEVSQDLVYGFYSSEPFSGNPIPFPMRAMVMVSVVTDGSAELKELRLDYKVIGEADWLPDGRGAVVTDVAGQQDEWPLNGTLHWLPADGSQAITLPQMGRSPRWGFLPKN